MSITSLTRRRIRKNFGSGHDLAKMPNLIEMQRPSYERFLQMDYAGRDDAPNEGLTQVFNSVFPITDAGNRARLEFMHFDFDKPKYDVDECRQRGMNYSASLKVTLRLIVFDIDDADGSRSVKDVKEQEVYLGDLFLMAESGTFIVNGTERVVVSQMQRSPGVFFQHDKGKSHSSGKILYSARIIPYRGSWLDIEFDGKDLVHARIDRRRKLPVTTLLRALEMDEQEILSTFYNRIVYLNQGNGWQTDFNSERVADSRLLNDLIDGDSGEIVEKAGTKITKRILKRLLDGGLKSVRVEEHDLIGAFLADDLVNLQTGEIFGEAGDEITSAMLEESKAVGQNEIAILDIDYLNVGPYIRNTLVNDRNDSYESALFEIYRVIRPGEPPTIEAAKGLFEEMFFSEERFDFLAVGRVKTNQRLGLDCDVSIRVLRKEDIIATIKTLLDIKDGRGEIDDIDNLGNRRVRSVGELMENQYRAGLLRVAKGIRDRIGTIDVDRVMPHDLINSKPLTSAVRDFFSSSQLSQFMDQTNPLSEVTHKRRLSALGPGGLSRERAGFEVRDVHPTHYGRICPVETPEGPNIGLISSMACFARVNDYGFIETPYRKVVNGIPSDVIEYVGAMAEQRNNIAQSDLETDADGRLVGETTLVRKGEDVVAVPIEDVNYMDVSAKQLVSVAAAMIPFLENDDANRALMGSNMQRQAVPLLRADAPFVGTGMEKIVAQDSAASVVAERTGVIDQVDATRIVVRATEERDPTKPGVDIYRLKKYQRSNQNTYINQQPLVKVGDRVMASEVIADGAATEQGDLALGRNVLVAFMPWKGYNFEDSILLSERLVADDVFTSIHIEEFEVSARDTKLGPEEITREVVNVSEEALRDLDEAGIVHVGAVVEPGSILVGKITPKGETPMTSEEKLLRAIFGERASDVRDTSLKLPPGANGTVVEVRVLNRHGIEKDERALAIERSEIQKLAKDRDDERTIVDRNIHANLADRLVGHKIINGPTGTKKGAIIDKDLLDSLSRYLWWQLIVEDTEIVAEIEKTRSVYEKLINEIDERFHDKVDKVQRGDDLPTGVMKIVKVFVAIKRKIQPGDKMAGRHGNKGVVSNIVAAEDMPFLADGRPIDMVLNCLGVSSRMNVGQILETHLGWACAGMGQKIGQILEECREQQNYEKIRALLSDVYHDDAEAIASVDDQEIDKFASMQHRGISVSTPVFSGAKLEDIEGMLTKAGLSQTGSEVLYDGSTGEAFDRRVTVGYIYMLKLHHLVDDKIHARSIGPYSLVTQQPLGGKAHFGGQRFGEMEVWALEAYGAAYTLQEMLTVKSDYVAGRTKVYEAIVRNEEVFNTGTPESFNVLVKEMRALGLDVEMKSHDVAPTLDLLEADKLSALPSPEDMAALAIAEAEIDMSFASEAAEDETSEL